MTTSPMPCSKEEELKPPLQMLLDSMDFVEQYADRVVAYTSKYNNAFSVTYSPENLTGKPSKYPQYGDFPETYMLRSYGKWWKDSLSVQQNYMPQDCDPIESEDYVIVRYEFPVVPSKIIIYETYNPGAVVRIYGRHTGGQWYLLFEQEPEVIDFPENTARCFSPKLNQIQNIVNEIRIELNQSQLKYHTALDAILLAGYAPLSKVQLYLLTNGLESTPGPQFREHSTKIKYVIPEGAVDHFKKLPYEVMVHIFEFLDLKTLQRCALVNKRFNEVTLDPNIYKTISLKKYWMKVDDQTLKYFQNRCLMLRKLDLRWCGNNYLITENFFQGLLRNCGRQITHLSLSHCDFVRNVSLGAISRCSHLIDLRLRDCSPCSWSFSMLVELTRLQSLDVSTTNISTDALNRILMANRNLKHLLIDYCENLNDMDDIMETISRFNEGMLTLSCWKTRSLTARGVKFLARLTELKELDMGWCLLMSEPANCLHVLAHGCKDLTRLILANWRGLTDQDVMPIISNCKQLTLLDLLGIPNITSALGAVALSTLPKLRLLELSFCEKILVDEVSMWREFYPHVTILHYHDSRP